jgi:hypothetical protein
MGSKFKVLAAGSIFLGALIAVFLANYFPDYGQEVKALLRNRASYTATNPPSAKQPAPDPVPNPDADIVEPIH